MKELKRTVVGDFKIEDSHFISEVEENKDKLETFVISIEKLFNSSKEINLEKTELEVFLNGVKLKKQETNGIYRIYNDTIFLGIGIVENNILKRDVIL